MRRAARTDGNHKEIVAAFRKLGVSVRQTYQLPDGGGDIVVGVHGFNVLVEIKDGNLSPSKRELTPDEQVFRDDWKGWHEIVESIDDVVALVADLALWSKRLEEYGWKWKTGK